MSEFERARVALGYVPPDDRDTWSQVGMALKAEFGEEGFWNEWSQGAQNYNGKDARDVEVVQGRQDHHQHAVSPC
jgi:putative DNA primase/helicase